MPDEKPILSEVVPQLVETSISLDSSPDSKSRVYAASHAPSLPQIPGYELLEQLGEGGMGIVYKARHLKLNRFVAVKFLRNAEYASDEALKRFFTEAQINAELQHANLVDVYDYGEIGRMPYLVMEYLEKKSLVEQLKINRRLKPKTAARVVEKIARGVHAAHEKGIIHRDLKPGNILFAASGEPKVADFGLARRSSSDLTRSQAIMGTPYYMSPEQAKGQSKLVGPPADVWALGVILYECVTGVRPFTSEDPISMLLRIVSDEPESMRSYDANIPWELEAIVQKCLAKSPEHRYANAGELADALTVVHSDQGIIPLEAAAVTKTYRAKPQSNSAKWLAFTAVAVVLFGAIGTAGWFWKQAQDAKPGKLEGLAAVTMPDAIPPKPNPEIVPPPEPEPAKPVARPTPEPMKEPPPPVLKPVADPKLPVRQEEANIPPPMKEEVKPAPIPTKVEQTPLPTKVEPTKLETKPVVSRYEPPPVGTVRRTTGEPTTIPEPLNGHDGKPRTPPRNSSPPVPTGTKATHDWTQVMNFRGHRNVVNTANLNAEGSFLVTASDDYTAKIWNAKTGLVRFTLSGHRACVNSAEFSPKGNYVLTGSCDGTVKIWNTNTGIVHNTIALTGNGRVYRAHFSPCATKILILTFDDREAGIWDLTLGKYSLIFRGHTNSLTSGCFSPDGSRILTTSNDRTAKVWDAKTGQHLFTYTGHQNSVESGFFVTPGGTQAFTFASDKQAKGWDCATGSQLFFVDGVHAPFNACYFAEGTKRLFTARTDGHVEVYEPFTTRRIYTEDAVVGTISSVWANLDTLQVVTIANSNAVTLWDTGKLSRALLTKSFQPAVPTASPPTVKKENPFKK